MKIIRTQIFLFLLIIVPHLYSLELSLLEAAERALTVSPDLSDQRAKIGNATINYRRQLTQFLPQITVNAGKNDSIIMNTTDTHQYSISTQVSQPIFNGGRTYLGRKLLKMQISQQQNEYALQEEVVMDEVWKLYYGIITQGKKISLYRKAIDITEYQLNVSKVQLELGELTELDYLEAEIQYQTFLSSLSQETLSLEKMQFELKRLLSIEQHITLVLTDDISVDYDGITLGYSLDELFDIANTYNLSLRKSTFELASIRAQIRMERFSFLPQISLNGSYSISDDDMPLQNQSYGINLEFIFPFKNIPITASFGYNESLNKSYGISQNIKSPINNDVSYIADRKAARISYQAMNERLESERKSLYSQLYFYIQNLRHQKEILQQLRNEEQLYTRKQNLMKLQLELGKSTLTDYLEVEKTAFEKQLEILEAVLALKQSERELEKMLGFPMGEISNVYNY